MPIDSAPVAAADWLQIIGVAGFALAVASLLWQVQTWREGHKERITVTLRNQAPDELAVMRGRQSKPALVAEVVNVGRVSVFVKEVVLERVATNEPPPSFGPGPVDGIVRAEFQRPDDADEGLVAGQASQFALTEGAGFLKKFLESEEVWLAVRSNRGELCRMKTNTFMAQLKLFHDTIAPGEQRELENLRDIGIEPPPSPIPSSDAGTSDR